MLGFFFITDQKAPVVLKRLSSPGRVQVYKQGSSYYLTVMNACIRSDRYAYSSVLANYPAIKRPYALNILTTTSHKSVKGLN